MSGGSSVSPILKQLIYGGKVASVGAGTFPLNTFISNDLKGFGDHEFESHWYVFVTRKGDNTITPPFGQYRLCTAYTSLTGQFAVNYFSASLTVGDEVYVIHESLVAAMNAVNTQPFLPAMIETWQFIDSFIWTKTNPVTGAAWNNVVGISPPGCWATATPNASEFARLVSRDFWLVGPGVFSPTTRQQGFYLEFELMVTNEANIDLSHTFYGLSLPGDDRTSNNLIGVIYNNDGVGGTAGRLLALQDIGGVESSYIISNLEFIQPLECKIRIECVAGAIRWYVNEVAKYNLVSASLASTDGQAVVNFNHATNATGPSAIRIGQVAMGYLPRSS